MFIIGSYAALVKGQKRLWLGRPPGASIRNFQHTAALRSQTQAMVVLAPRTR